MLLTVIANIKPASPSNSSNASTVNIANTQGSLGPDIAALTRIHDMHSLAYDHAVKEENISSITKENR